MPKISVVIPIYNGEKTIQETLESLFQQTFQDFEAIAIDDGSQDRTLEILQSISDSRLTIYSYANSGPSASRNRGIFHATGEYIAFLDADDLWTPDKLEAQLKALQNHPKAALAYSWTDYIDEAGNFVKNGKHITVSGNVYECILVNNFIENGSNPLVYRHVFSEMGKFDEQFFGVEDWDMWNRIAARYEFVAVPKVQILYRVMPSSTSTNVSQQEQQSLKAIEKAFSQAPEPIKYLKRKTVSNLYKYLMWKVIEGYPSWRNGRAATRCFWNYLRLNPQFILQPKLIVSIALKITIIVILPPKYAKNILDKWAGKTKNKSITF